MQAFPVCIQRGTSVLELKAEAVRIATFCAIAMVGVSRSARCDRWV